MAEQILIPKLGMAAQRAVLTEWKAKEGDWVEKGSVILTIEEEKTGFEVTAGASGFLHILVEEGGEAPVNTVVGVIAETKEELEALQKEGRGEVSFSEVKKASIVEVAVSGAKTTGGERIPISPLARKMAEEHMIDISKVEGTGPDGRITKEDIEKAIEAKKMEVPQLPTEVHAGKRVKETIPFKGMRKAIAEHMLKSLSINAAHTFNGEFDLSELAKCRDDFLRQEKAIGTRITYAEIFVFVVAKALKRFPMINSSLIDNEIKIWEDINIGVAVGLGEQGEKGLIVPVIKNADRKSLVEISLITKSLVEKAHAGKLTPDEVTGGTFTVSNFGPRGVSFYSRPIINLPEAAILGIGRITDKPVVKNGQIVIAPIMPYSLTQDHRILDGAVTESFLMILKDLVENPDLLLLW